VTSSDYPPRRSAWAFVVVLALAGVVSVLDRSILNIVVDPVRGDLGLSEVQIGLLQGLAFGVFYATVGIPLGLLADRRSRKWLIVGGIALWSLATVASGFAESFGGLFAARLLVGLGEAALSPAAISLIADLFPPNARGRPISVFLMGQAAANGLGISIVSFLTDAAAAGRFERLDLVAELAPWRVAFVGCGLLGFLVIAALLPLREPGRRTGHTSVGLLEQTRAIGGYLLMHRAIFVPLYLGFALVFLAIYGAAAWAPTMLLRVFGSTRAQLGTIFGPMTMALAIAGPLIGGWLVDAAMRRGDSLARFRILVIAPLLMIPSGLAVLAPNALTAMVLVAYKPAFVAVIGTTMLALLQSLVPPDMRGTAVSLTGLVNTVIGATLGPLLISIVTEQVLRDNRQVGTSIALVVIPALVLASALYAMAQRAIRRSVADGSAPAVFVSELRSAGATVSSER
jgi:MFS family permease